MSIVIYQIKNGAPTSYHLRQTEILAPKPETGELKYIGYYRGQNSIFSEDILNSDIKASKVPDFIFNPTRNKCELRFDDRDTALLKYVEAHPHNGVKFELYSEEIENEAKLGKAESIEKALDYVKESDQLKIRALGLAVLGLSSYNQSASSVKALLKDKAINKPKQVINACEDELFENKFIAALALCAGIVKTNSTMTAIVWADNNGRILNIATGEDFVTKFAQHISSKSPENQSILQEIGKRLELTKEKKASQSKEAERIAELEAKIAALESQNTPPAPTQEELDSDILAMREKYTEVTGKNLSIRFQNDMEWMQAKIDEHTEE